MHDLRYSVRALRGDLRLTTCALLGVALGIGATVTVFGEIDALLLRPLPFREAERLVWISNGDAYDLLDGAGATVVGVLPPTFDFGTVFAMALGATPARVRSTVLSRTLRLAALGLAVGLLASRALGRVLRGLLFGVGSADPLTFGLTLAVLALVAATAGWLPARRASRQNPAAVLRAD